MNLYLTEWSPSPRTGPNDPARLGMTTKLRHERSPVREVPMLRVLQIRQKGAHAEAGSALGRVGATPVGPDWSTAVDMRPGQTVGELLQEERGVDRRPGPAGAVLQVGDVATDQVAVLGVQRQLTEPLDTLTG